MGRTESAVGVKGESKTKEGVRGEGGWIGVVGISNEANEPNLPQKSFSGVYGESTHEKGGSGVVGISKNRVGVYGESQTKEGVHGECKGQHGAGVVALNTGGGIGILAKGTIAGRFEGDVDVTGDIRLQNADCAEDFDIVESKVNVEAGTVMVLTENGSLESSHQEYDKKVVGIVSGAGGYKPAFILNRYSQSQNENQNKKNKTQNKHRLPIALMGKVYCKVDARNSPIEIGDLLTSSSKKGYAMKADDHAKAFGAVIGKALDSIKEGLGMIPVLVTLQ